MATTVFDCAAIVNELSNAGLRCNGYGDVGQIRQIFVNATVIRRGKRKQE